MRALLVAPLCALAHAAAPALQPSFELDEHTYEHHGTTKAHLCLDGNIVPQFYLIGHQKAAQPGRSGQDRGASDGVHDRDITGEGRAQAAAAAAAADAFCAVGQRRRLGWLGWRIIGADQ